MILFEKKNTTPCEHEIAGFLEKCLPQTQIF